MKKNISIQIEGLKETLKKFDNSKKEILKAIDYGTWRAALHYKGSVQSAIAGNDGFKSAVDTGYFRERVYAIKSGFATANVGSNQEYSIYLEYGTSPHFVAPKNKKALSWGKGIQKFFSKGHMVSGIKPRRYFTKTLMMQEENMKKIVQLEVNKVIKKTQKPI